MRISDWSSDVCSSDLNNLLSINGVNVARVSASERIRVEKDGANDNGGRMHVEVVPSPYFDVHVRNQAAGVAAPMAMASGMQARSAATADVAQKDRKSTRLNSSH